MLDTLQNKTACILATVVASHRRMRRLLGLLTGNQRDVDTCRYAPRGSHTRLTKRETESTDIPLFSAAPEIVLTFLLGPKDTVRGSNEAHVGNTWEPSQKTAGAGLIPVL